MQHRVRRILFIVFFLVGLELFRFSFRSKKSSRFNARDVSAGEQRSFMVGDDGRDDDNDNRTKYGYRTPRPPYPSIVHASHNCTTTLPEGSNRTVILPVALPHLILIGAQKAGTSSLQSILDRHSEVIKPSNIRQQETHFLDWDVFGTGRKGRFDGSNEDKLCALREKYAAYFDMDKFTQPQEEGNKLPMAFEKSPSYMCFHEIPPAIDAICPWKPRILAILRNPATRAYSHYLFDTTKLLPNTRHRSFEEVVEDEVKLFVNYGLLGNGTIMLSEYERLTNDGDWDGTASPIDMLNITLDEYHQRLVIYRGAPTSLRVKGKLFNLFRGLYALLLLPWAKQFGPEDRMMILNFEEFAEHEREGRRDIEDRILHFAGIFPANPSATESSSGGRRLLQNCGNYSSCFRRRAKELTESSIDNPGRMESHKRWRLRTRNAAAMKPKTKEYLKFLFQPFNDFLPEVLGEDWRGVWDDW